eukprot:1164209-Pleurochrysis_carterae.AAC.1
MTLAGTRAKRGRPLPAFHDPGQPQVTGGLMPAEPWLEPMLARRVGLVAPRKQLVCCELFVSASDRHGVCACGLT